MDQDMESETVGLLREKSKCSLQEPGYPNFPVNQAIHRTWIGLVGHSPQC